MRACTTTPDQKFMNVRRRNLEQETIDINYILEATNGTLAVLLSEQGRQNSDRIRYEHCHGQQNTRLQR